MRRANRVFERMRILHTLGKLRLKGGTQRIASGGQLGIPTREIAPVQRR